MVCLEPLRSSMGSRISCSRRSWFLNPRDRFPYRTSCANRRPWRSLSAACSRGASSITREELPVLTSRISGLVEELANQTLLFFILDARKQLCSQSGDCFGFVEGHFVVNFAALEMAWLAAGLKDWLDLGVKVGLCNRRV